MRLSRVLWLAGPLLGGIAALLQGQDANWDLRVYHYYNPYAFLAGRLNVDIIPALNPTFYNPLLDLPVYFAAQALPARLVGFLLGAFQGLIVPLLVALGLRLLPGGVGFRQAIALVLALVGATGAMTLVQFGATFHDNTLAVPVLAALLLVLRAQAQAERNEPVDLSIATAALLSGLAFGLKLTMAIYVAGFAAALLAALPPRLWLRAVLVAGIAGLAGTLLTGGWWSWHLWQEFANPFFPHFNDLFRSDMAGPVDFRDRKFLEKLDLVDRIVFPFLFTFDSWKAAEGDFRDPRLLLAFLAALPALALCWRAEAKARAVVVFAAVAYVLWVLVYGIYRYLLPLEMLAPVIVLAALRCLRLDRSIAARAAAALSLLAAALTLYPDFPDPMRAPWTERFVQLDAPPRIAQPERTLVLLPGDRPTAFMIPEFPPAIRFVHVSDWPYLYQSADKGYEPIVRKLLAEHDGALLALFGPQDEARTPRVLERFGLRLTADCQPVKANLVPWPFRLCRVEKS
ncbi:MAG: hypothetical protein AB7R90_17600 [Reyranellaceae bacterium]